MRDKDSERRNARIPASIEDFPVGKEVFYVINMLVPEQDGSRVIGPLDAEGLEDKRRMYKQITKGFEDKEKYPFVVYKLKRTE